MKHSVICDDRECYFCRKTYNLHKHHVLNGPDRKHAEEDGLWVWLCIHHHTTGPSAVHVNHNIDFGLKKTAQRKYEETHTREEWMRRYRRNYLDE